METSAEVCRLRHVYQQYAACGLGESKWSDANRGNQVIQGERNSKTCELLQQAGFFPLGGRRILDVGCGTGKQLGLFLEWGARPEDLFGIDLIPDRVSAARALHPRMNIELANAESLPYANGAFDLVVVSTVFSSILDRVMSKNIVGEISRVLAPQGAVLWYDFRMNNPFNRHVRGMSRKHIQDLFPGFGVALEATSLLPPLARRLGALTDHLYSTLNSLPFLRTHLLGLLTKPAGPGGQIS
jgi:SAM-dependent methyltransferase